MTEPSGSKLETLWEDVEFVLSRGVREGEPAPFLEVAPASAQPAPSFAVGSTAAVSTLSRFQNAIYPPEDRTCARA